MLATLRQILRAVSLHSRHLIRYVGVTGPQLLLIREIAARSGVLSSELVRTVSMSHATISTVLRRLEEHKFVRRERSATDKRKMHLFVTQKAHRLLRTNPNPLQGQFLQEFSQLELWEQHLLISSIQRVATMLLNAATAPDEKDMAKFTHEDDAIADYDVNGFDG